MKLGDAKYLNVEHTSAKGGVTWTALYRAPISRHVNARSLLLPSLRRRLSLAELDTNVLDEALRKMLLELVRNGLVVSVGASELVARSRSPDYPEQVFANLNLIERIVTRASAIESNTVPEREPAR
ncbi:MAG: hypothetical protein QM817_06680 [Archangium sp.]